MADTDRKVFAVCVGAASIFWLILNLSQEYTIRQQVALNYTITPERVLVGDVPREINAEITGQGWTLIWEYLRSGPLEVTVNTEEKESTLLSRDQLQQEIKRNLYSGALSVDYMDFESFRVLTTPLAGKRVPIVPRIAAKPAPGYVIVDSLLLSVDSVTVNAATDALEEIGAWMTQELTLDNVDDRREGLVSLVKAREGYTLSLESVRYSVAAEPYIERSITVPVTVLNAPANERYEISPEEVSVRVAVPESMFDRVDRDDFTVEADVAAMRDGAFSPRIALQLTKTPKWTVSAFLETRSITYYAIR